MTCTISKRHGAEHEVAALSARKFPKGELAVVSRPDGGWPVLMHMDSNGWLIFPIPGSCPAFSVSGPVFRYDGTQHVIFPLSVANELRTVRPLLLDRWRANHFNFRNNPDESLFLSLSSSHSPLLDPPRHARTNPFIRSGKTSVPASPHLRISSNLSDTPSEATAQSDTRHICPTSPFR